MNSNRELLKKLFVISVILFLSTGIVRAAAFPAEENVYESRYAYQLPKLSIEKILDSSFQNEAEDALADQLPLSSYFKKAYNIIKYRYLRTVAFPVAENYADRYFGMETVDLYNGKLVYEICSPSDFVSQIGAVEKQYNKIAEQNPDTEFYIYYVESDHDINFDTGEKSGVFDYIKEISSVPEENIGCLELTDYNDYSRTYYDTDIHWKNTGSYEGYREIIELLDCGEPLIPAGEAYFYRQWCGSKARDIGDFEFTEDFTAYIFDFPPMKYTVSGQEIEHFDNQRSSYSGDEYFTYMSFYGGSTAEAVIETERPELDNLMIVGDSFSLAVFRLAASHFNKTCLIDPRRSEMTIEEYGEYIQKNDIDKVLFLNYYSTVRDERFIISE